jgi:hypothetical protein
MLEFPLPTWLKIYNSKSDKNYPGIGNSFDQVFVNKKIKIKIWF